jgi:hypothetical protein
MAYLVSPEHETGFVGVVRAIPGQLTEGFLTVVGFRDWVPRPEDLSTDQVEHTTMPAPVVRHSGEVAVASVTNPNPAA